MELNFSLKVGGKEAERQKTMKYNEYITIFIIETFKFKVYLFKQELTVLHNIFLI